MKRVSSIAAVLLGIGALLAPIASAAPGDLDPSFGSGGSARFFPGKEAIALNGVAVQPDGKVVMTGVDIPTGNLLVVRLLENGSFDAGFGTGGIVSAPFPGGFGAGSTVAIQPDGKIVVAGAAQGAVNADFLAARFNADGSPDAGFGGGDGIEIVPVGTEEDEANALTIGAGGRILLTGEAELPGDKVAAGVVVLLADGKPDPSFDTDGITTLSETGMALTDRGEGIAEQPDGRIVIADATGGNFGFTLVRLLADGQPDPAFGIAGVVNTPIPGSPAARGQVADVLVQPDGRIVAAGAGRDEVAPAKFDPKFAAVRYLPDGELDKSFGGGTGIFSQQIGPGENEGARRIALAPNGKLVLAGQAPLPPPISNSVAVMRLDPSGALDPSFGAGGIAQRGPTALFGSIYEDAALDSRERVVVLGRNFIGNDTIEAEVSRFLGDVPPDQPLSPPQAMPPAPAPKPPHARMKAVPRKLPTTKLTGFSGSAASSSSGGSVAKVQIALVRAAAAKAGRAATCHELKNARGGSGR